MIYQNSGIALTSNNIATSSATQYPAGFKHIELATEFRLAVIRGTENFGQAKNFHMHLAQIEISHRHAALKRNAYSLTTK
jgi:hypothetical protein